MNSELYNRIVVFQQRTGKDNVDSARTKMEEYLSEKYHRVLYIKGETIAKEGRIEDNIYLIERGKVAMSRRDMYGREYSGGYMMPGEFFGLSSCIDMPNEASYKALTNCNVIVIETEVVKKLMKECPQAGELINFILINTIRLITVRQGNLIGGGCRSSFVNFIAEHFHDFGRLDDNGDVIVTLDVNLIDIAEILNMTRETLSRIISEMKKEGIIDTKRRFIKIKDLGRFLA